MDGESNLSQRTLASGKIAFPQKISRRRDLLHFHHQSAFAVFVFLRIAAPEDAKAVLRQGSEAARIFQQQLPVTLQQVFEFPLIVAGKFHRHGG